MRNALKPAESAGFSRAVLSLSSPPRTTTRRTEPSHATTGVSGSAREGQTTIHCWFVPEVHAAWSRAAPLAVDAPATSRHLPLLALAKVT